MAQPQLKWDHVDSSNVNRIAFDEGSHALCVEFKGGGLYAYTGVSDDHYHGLMGSESVGKYLNSVIKASYPYTRFGDEEELLSFLTH